MRCEKCKAPMYNHGRKMACVKCGRILLLKPRRVLQEGGILIPIIPLPPTVRPWFLKYGDTVLRAILQSYKPVDQIVSTSYLTTAIQDDPDLSSAFAGMTRQTVRRAIVLCLRYCCGADWYTNRKQQQRAVILPVPVGELERYVQSFQLVILSDKGVVSS